MKVNRFQVNYPRHVLRRRIMRVLGRGLLALLSDVVIHGRDRLPQKGPIILAGNHVAVLEAVMMAVYTPGIVEFLGNGDIPFDPNYAFIAKAYDLIPVNRGNLDRKSLQTALDLLNQGGILGIFPEGGIWDPAQMQAQTGVAWLSFRSQAPVLPIGFGGINGALADALKFKHPRLVMNVGECLPPVSLADDSLSMKDNLQAAANKIMTGIKALIPREDLQSVPNRLDESFRLIIAVKSPLGPVQIPEKYMVHHDSAYAHFLFQPTMMDVLVRNLRLPIKPIKRVSRQTELIPLITAWEAILAYLEVNPGYFTYRFGIDEGLAVKKALLELVRLAKWAEIEGYGLSIMPIYQFRNVNTNALVTIRCGDFPNSM